MEDRNKRREGRGGVEKEGRVGLEESPFPEILKLGVVPRELRLNWIP